MEVTQVEKQPFISIVVPTFRRPQVLGETLTALLGVDYPKHLYEVIVIDDGSEDETGEVVSHRHSENPRLLYLYQPNRGVATARNQGARMASGEVLIFVDDDIIVPSNLITIHLETMADFGDCVVNGHWEFTPELTDLLRQTPFGQFRMEVERWVKEGIQKRPLSENCSEPAGVTACNMAMRREHFWRLGGFDEQFPFAGCEDQEFSLRAAAAKYRFVYNHDLRFWHNDHRLTLEQFCERQRRGATTAALLAIKHPQECAGRPLILENRPIQPTDPPPLVAKKLIKSLLATEPALAVLRGLISTIERTWPHSPWLSRLYWAVCGLYIFRGIREGLARYSDDNPSAPQSYLTVNEQ